MAFDKEKLHQQALSVAKKKKCYFIEQLVHYLPCSKPTFYDHFPVDSYELNSVKEILESNIIETKSKMYKKWFDSDNPTLQISLMKIIGNEHEVKRLNNAREKDSDKPIVIKIENQNE